MSQAWGQYGPLSFNHTPFARRLPVHPYMTPYLRLPILQFLALYGVSHHVCFNQIFRSGATIHSATPVPRVIDMLL